MEQRSIKALVYADIDLNIIDGSSIWVTSILETLAQDPTIKPTILLKRPITREVLITSIEKYPNINIIDPWSTEFDHIKKALNDDSWKKTKRLTVEQAAEIIDLLDRQYRYDFLLFRGYELSQEISSNYTYSKRSFFYLTDFPQRESELSDQDMRNLRLIYENGACLACQTQTLIEYFKKLLDVKEDNKFILLPPMVPNQEMEVKEFFNKQNKLIYAGKFAPFWNIPEMFEAFSEIKDKNLEFIVLGDKFHNYPYTEDFQERVKEILNNTEGIIWKKALPRMEVQTEIKNSDLGISWRHPELDDSKELSTKILEFGLNGKPVIMNRNDLHENVFGADYPLYANNKEEFIEKIQLAFSDKEIFRMAAERMYQVSRNHMFVNVSKQIEPLLRNKIAETNQYLNISLRKYDRKKILFAGHDLKFAKMLIDYFSSDNQYQVKLDQWSNHNVHDESQSRKLVEWADVVIAEWGLGNAVWYSKNKKPNQSLIVRMHLQEKNTPFPKKVLWENVDQIVFIAPGLKKEMIEHFPFLPQEKIKVIFNLVDTDFLNKEKLPDSNFNIGLMGISPSRKRLDMALDIFEKLWIQDNRYTLFVKGHLPNQYQWLWNRKNERKYFEEAFRRINSSAWSNSVVFEGWGDVSEWYRKINFVLSPSDFESFHLAVAEGMASKTIPVIRNWFGADLLYPKKYIFETVQEAVDIVTRTQQLSEKEASEEKVNLQDYIYQNYDKKVICKQWGEMIEQLSFAKV